MITRWRFNGGTTVYRAVLWCLITLSLLAPTRAMAQTVKTIWGADTGAFSEAFNAAAAKRNLRLNIGSVICVSGRSLNCDASTGSLGLKLRGTDNPASVREVAIPYTGSTPMAMVAGLSHVIMDIAEPNANPDERRTAVLSLFGLGGVPRNDSPQVGQTRLRIRDGFRGGEVIFQLAAQP